MPSVKCRIITELISPSLIIIFVKSFHSIKHIKYLKTVSTSLLNRLSMIVYILYTEGPNSDFPAIIHFPLNHPNCPPHIQPRFSVSRERYQIPVHHDLTVKLLLLQSKNRPPLEASIESPTGRSPPAPRYVLSRGPADAISRGESRRRTRPLVKGRFTRPVKVRPDILWIPRARLSERARTAGRSAESRRPLSSPLDAVKYSANVAHLADVYGRRTVPRPR